MPESFQQPQHRGDPEPRAWEARKRLRQRFPDAHSDYDLAAEIVDATVGLTPSTPPSPQDVLDAIALLEGIRVAVDLRELDLLTLAARYGVSLEKVATHLGLASAHDVNVRQQQLQERHPDTEDDRSESGSESGSESEVETPTS